MAVNASDGDYYLGNIFYFKCPRSYYLGIIHLTDYTKFFTLL